ncbi:Protein CBG19735 [Caenorhabditis briggsae]|uniref:Protein CBG19735 n=1 Tax=Caenorhabditis briggsae TaxID=6238 RepID=A8XWF9_CAEBR|nr:Protein CBG19735 [Caenorhabditis briggsae]CAP36978.2 Protein CBG19735 [Caenorhabditis briggsae]
MARSREQGRKRKIPRCNNDQPVIPKLQYIGQKLNHPLLINDAETKLNRRSRAELTQSPNIDVSRMICFAGIPACVLSARGTGQNSIMAEGQAAHAMLDFFRSATSPLFVHQLCAATEMSQLDEHLPTLRKFLSSSRSRWLRIFAIFQGVPNWKTSLDCSQLETTSAALVRGREVKKRVLQNLRQPEIGYNAARNEEQKPAALPEPPKLTPKRVDPEVVTLGDSEEEAEIASDDVQVLREKILKKKEEMAIRGSPKSPSPETEKLRPTIPQHPPFCSHRRLVERVDSTTYFGELNTSRQGPSDVFCSLPNTNTIRYAVAESEDDESDDGEEAVPSKRAKMGEQGDEVIVLNTTSSGEAPGTSSGGKAKKDTDEFGSEIGDIVDEWDESDDVASTIPDPDSTKPESPTSSTDMTDSMYNGHPNHRSLIASLGLPSNYQARTIGVVLNEKMAVDVESYVAKVVEKSLDSITWLSRLCWDHYRMNSQPDPVLDMKLDARRMLHREFQRLFPDKCVMMQITGSTINGCGSYNSDVDMCLCYPTNSYKGTVFDDFQNERSQSAKVLRKLDKAIRRSKPGHPLRQHIRYCEMVPAKVPIIKLKMQGAYPDMEVDINVNNIAGIYNSHLTHYYSLIDARFPVLALAIKHWASRQGVNNAQAGYLNSYTIILLVVHFLQCGVSPAVLPNLQYLFPEKFDKKLPISALQLYGDIAERLPTSAPNTWSIGELFVGFFHYYAHFDFSTQAISVRSAQVVPRSSLPHHMANYPIFVEEPFDAINTARSVRTPNHLNFIKREFRRAVAIINQPRFTLREIGVHVSGDEQCPL